MVLLVAAVLRFVWIGDVEYKDDEDQLFQYSQAIPATQLWPTVGTTSGVRYVRHPALGVWTFAVLAEVLHLRTPLAVTGSVAALSVATLALLFWFAWRVAPASHSEVWWWTAALAGVNLVATIYARKIWIPSLLPFFCVVLLIGWWYRHTRGGALAWGIVGALIGQIHMSGFFYAAAVLMGTALFAPRSVRWRAWFAGSAWGAVPALPWLHYLWSNLSVLETHASTLPWTSLHLDFFRTALAVALSQTAEVNIGGHFEEYLAYPVLFGVRTHGVQVARVALYVVAALALAIGVVAMLRRVGRLARRRYSDTDLCLFNGVVAGLLVSAAGVPDLPNHHLMVFPLEYLWLPLLVTAWCPKPRVWLTAVWLGSAVCTLGFLQFIHAHCGAPNGDYGVSYRCQPAAGLPTVNGPAARSPALEALIPPGREVAVGRMLGHGDALPGSCRLTEGRIDRTLARATYACGDVPVTLELVHRSKARDAALRTRDFGILVVEGAPPAGFLDAIAARVRDEERRFEWLLEAGPVAEGDASHARSWGGSPPAITARQLLLRVGAATVLLLLSSPWWYGRRADVAHAGGGYR